MATVNESLRDEAIAHSVWISRYATGVANRMVKLLNETDSELSARLLDALDRLPADSFRGYTSGKLARQRTRT